VQAGERQARGPVRLQHAARGGARDRRCAQLHGHARRQDDHAGWIEIGGNVDQIVAAVIKETGFGKEPRPSSTSSTGSCAIRRPADHLRGDKARFEQFITAAQSDGVWSSQARASWPRSTARLPGVVSEHWTSYKAEARKKGITGYQFRRPANGSPSSTLPGSSASSRHPTGRQVAEDLEDLTSPLARRAR
jgi:hypothetical protein